MSLRGYCRTLSDDIACKPAMTITKLTTSASTGRRMKRSVKPFMTAPGRKFEIRNPKFETNSKLEIQNAKHAVAAPLCRGVARRGDPAHAGPRLESPSFELRSLFRISTFG